MKEDKLGNLSMELSVEVLNLVKDLRNKKENIMQLKIEASGGWGVTGFGNIIVE